MTLTIRDTGDNWFVLENERMGRINGADIEGNRAEWAAVAVALDLRESISFKRVAFAPQPSGNWLASSPRNSISPSVVTADVAIELAAEIPARASRNPGVRFAAAERRRRVTRGGLLIAGVIVPVEGLEVDNPTTASWCRLHPRDYRARRSSWVRQVILHTTKGIDPQRVLPGVGPSSRSKRVADYWYGDTTQSAAHLVVGSDGRVACLADLARVCAYHATVSNDWSVGVEIYQELGGGIYEAALASAVRLVDALCEHLEIPRQIPKAYQGHPIARMEHGGRDCVGVLGHRDNTTRRGRGDPATRSSRASRRRGTSAWTSQLARTSRSGVGASGGSMRWASSSPSTGSRGPPRCASCERAACATAASCSTRPRSASPVLSSAAR